MKDEAMWTKVRELAAMAMAVNKDFTVTFETDGRIEMNINNPAKCVVNTKTEYEPVNDEEDESSGSEGYLDKIVKTVSGNRRMIPGMDY